MLDQVGVNEAEFRAALANLQAFYRAIGTEPHHELVVEEFALVPMAKEQRFLEIARSEGFDQLFCLPPQINPRTARLDVHARTRR